MFFVNWFWDVLGYFGLSRKSARIVFLGLDNAGKTTLLHMLKDDRVAQHVPTLHPHSEELIVGKIRFKTFDLGGHETARRIWRDYFAAVDAIVFMVDATDRGRFQEAKEELTGLGFRRVCVQHLLETQELASVPFVVLGNKIDKPQAASEEELRQQLGLYAHITFGRDRKPVPGVRPVEIFMCSVIKRMGYADGVPPLLLLLLLKTASPHRCGSSSSSSASLYPLFIKGDLRSQEKISVRRETPPQQQQQQQQQQLLLPLLQHKRTAIQQQLQQVVLLLDAFSLQSLRHLLECRSAIFRLHQQQLV
ncbi:hypothetical protein Emed_006060 [Eimeria media]